MATKKSVGRQATKPAEKVGPEFVGKTPEADAAIEAAQNVVAQAYGAERDLVNQLLAQHQAFEASSKFLRTSAVSKLAFVKENKLYRGLRGMPIPHGAGKMTGTWEEFCVLLGRSVDQIDRDIENLRAFGEEALEAMSRMGIGYREFRKFRALPNDSKVALLEVAKQGDKEALLELAEDLIAKQEADKRKIADERDKAVNDYEAREKVIQATKDENAKLKEKLARIPKEKADERADAMVLEIAATITAATRDLKQIVKGTQLLFDHAQEENLSPDQYRAAVQHHIEPLIAEVTECVTMFELIGIDVFVERLRAAIAPDFGGND
jgi:hypothetical protein